MSTPSEGDGNVVVVQSHSPPPSPKVGSTKVAPPLLLRHLTSPSLSPSPSFTDTLTPSSPLTASPSTIHAPSPAFSTFSSSTFASQSTLQNEDPTPIPLEHPAKLSHLVRGGSGSQVAVLEKEREEVCLVTPPLTPEAELATPALDKTMALAAAEGGGGEKSCGCEASGLDKDVGRLGESTISKPEPNPLGKSTNGGFDRFGIPSDEALKEAEDYKLVGELGIPVSFGSLIQERGTVVVVFLRHLWCGLCAQYVVALSSASSHLSTLHSLRSTTNSTHSSASSASLPEPPKPPLYILLISNGSPSLIPIYRARLDCPFPLYVDKSRKLYKVFGMNKKTLDGGKDKDKGGYVTLSNVQNVVSSVKMGVAMGAGLNGKSPGNQSQLGGEFVLQWVDGRIECTYASRMSTTRNHSEVRDLFAAAGVHLNATDDASVFGTEDGSN